MATATRDFYFTKSAYTKEAWPNSVFRTNTSTNYLLSGNIDASPREGWYWLYFGGATGWPSSLKRNRIISASIRIYVQTGHATLVLKGVKDFDPATVTYNNDPDDIYASASNSAAELGLNEGVWSNVWINLGGNDAYYKADYALKMIQNGAFSLNGQSYGTYLGHPAWYAKTVLSDGSWPVLRVTYSTNEFVTSQASIVTRIQGTINTKVDQTCTWKLIRMDEYSSTSSKWKCFDDKFTQASAKFFWKASDASTWNQIAVSGSGMSVTVPAYTFPTGKTIEYYVQVTDTDGTTTNSTTLSFTTAPTQITQQNCPTSGYKNPRNDIPFSWYISDKYGSYPQASASLFWRVSGAETWNEIQAGTEQSLTVPANTFPTASTIEWYLSGVDTSGQTSQTPTYSFSTTAATAYATAVSPSGNVEDGSAPITFRWTLTSTDGLAMSKICLWWKLPSEDNQHWHVIKESTEIITEWTVPAGYFAAGETEWLVHAYNIDGTRGPDSKASFICVAAPDPVQGLAAEPVPLTTISWQSDGQEAYEITIDGEVVKKAYGVGVYSWQVPEPLADGEHIISVRIQGMYGLWSQPSETSIYIENAPETEIELSGEFDIDADLTVTGDPATAPVLHWYRDGKRIGKTSGTLNFRDRMALGRHEYFVEIWHESGNYSRSNTVIGLMDTQGPKIARLSGGEWIDIGLSENSADTQEFEWSQTAAWLHVTGSRLPILETSKYEDRFGSYDCAFMDTEQAKRFEQLKGQTVVIKSRKENVIVGALTSLNKRVLKFYTAYTFTIQAIEWEDFVQHDETN